MSLRSNFNLASYAKSAAACILLVALALLIAFAALRASNGAIAVAVAVSAALAALAAAVLAAASLLVLLRYRRGVGGQEDLFLALCRSREPGSIVNGAVARPGTIRRWLARRLLGHDMLVGDVVEVKTWP